MNFKWWGDIIPIRNLKDIADESEENTDYETFMDQ